MDGGRNEANFNLARVESKLTKEYKQAIREIKKKFNDYSKDFKDKDKEQKKRLKAGDITQEEYDKWRKMKLMQGERYNSLLDTLSAELVNADKIASSIINGYIPQVYGDAMNFGAYMVENITMYDTNFSLYNHDTVAYMLSKRKLRLLPQSSVDIPKDKRWTQKKLNSAIMQGVLQGDSIPKIAKRLELVSDMSRKSAIRNARTMTTSAEAIGRLESIKRANSLGLHMLKKWKSTLDLRTRESHRLLDGEVKEIDEPFSNGLMYPADPDGEPDEIYNCRCTLGTSWKELEQELSTMPRVEKLEGMTYEEWKYGKTSEDDLKRTLSNYRKDAQKYEKEVYSGIWRNPVTVRDYTTLESRIIAKRQYYEDRLQSVSDPVEKARLQSLVTRLDEFEQNGFEYSYLQEQIKGIDKAIKSRRQLTTNIDDRFSQERKDKAYWFINPNEADKVYRPTTSDVWKNLSIAERNAIYEYTAGSGSFNRPLRGYDNGWGKYNFKGVGNVPLNNEGSENDIYLMTEALSKAKLPYDVWIQRGVESVDGAISFLQIDEELWNKGTQSDLEDALLGKVVQDKAFLSCGSAKDSGFYGPLMVNLYCPEGTEALYVEPFSRFGGGIHWDGVSSATVKSELETIVQRDSYYRIIKVERTQYKTYIDVEVLGCDPHTNGR